jgi:DNA-binding LacI/PurR family transcriptional regulator
VVNRATDERAHNLQLAFLQPSHPFFDADWYRLATERAAASLGATLRPILYLHWHDSLIHDALDGFDGVFFMPPAEEIPSWLVDLFRKYAPGHVVVLERDLSHCGVQSICLFPASLVHRLLDHLAELGHRAIDCFNVHPMEPAVEARIEQWRIWKNAHGTDGREINEAGKYGGWISDQAYEAMSVLLGGGPYKATAVLCTTMPTAIGVLRAMEDHGIKVGRDVSVCTVNDDGVARYLSPSVTALLLPDPGPYVSRCIQKIRARGEEWICPLLVQLDHAPLFIGESTGKCVRTQEG